MKSIRLFLIVVMLASITLMIFLSALHGYRLSMTEAHQLFDIKLADTAHFLSVTHNGYDADDSSVVDTRSTAFQIWKDGKLLLRSSHTSVEPIALFTEGYGENNFSNHRWRTYSLYDVRYARWILTAERTDLRYSLAENIIIESVLPVVFIIPLGGLLIWIIVSYGLSPLRKLVTQLENKKADDLSALTVDKQPVELIKLVNSTNDLLHRLETSFQREKHFASDAAHELRTPISALKIHLHNLLKSKANDSISQHQQSIDELKSATDRMAHLVEQILVLNRTTPEQFFNRLEPIDLYALAQSVIIKMYDDFEKAKILLELQGETATVDGDRFALETLIHNLLSNACKYTPQGGSVILQVTPLADGVLLKIEDSGPGIPQDQHQRIFDRFYRLDGDRHASGQPGCGLGLAIVQHIVELHHADIELSQSSFESGLSVRIKFPVSSRPPETGNHHESV